MVKDKSIGSASVNYDVDELSLLIKPIFSIEHRLYLDLFLMNDARSVKQDQIELSENVDLFPYEGNYIDNNLVSINDNTNTYFALFVRKGIKVNEPAKKPKEEWLKEVEKAVNEAEKARKNLNKLLKKYQN